MPAFRQAQIDEAGNGAIELYLSDLGKANPGVRPGAR